MDKVFLTQYNQDGTFTKQQHFAKEPREKKAGSVLRVLAWQCIVSALFCLGAAGLRSYAPKQAEAVRALLVAQEQDPISQAAQCFLDNLMDGESVAVAVSNFYEELHNNG